MTFFRTLTCFFWVKVGVLNVKRCNNLTRLSNNLHLRIQPQVLYPSPTSLVSLDCSFNKLNCLPILPSSIEVLHCNNNQLTELPDLPNNLIILDCSYNDLVDLYNLSTSIKHLYCHYNKLKKLPKLPCSLEILKCSNNNLISLPDLPSNLKYLCCSDNNLTSLPILPESWIANQFHNLIIHDRLCLNYDNNPIYYFIEEHYNSNYLRYNILKESANIIGERFLKCKYDPSYKYCRNRLNKEYNELYS